MHKKKMEVHVYVDLRKNGFFFGEGGGGRARERELFIIFDAVKLAAFLFIQVIPLIMHIVQRRSVINFSLSWTAEHIKKNTPMCTHHTHIRRTYQK